MSGRGGEGFLVDQPTHPPTNPPTNLLCFQSLSQPPSHGFRAAPPLPLTFSPALLRLGRFGAGPASVPPSRSPAALLRADSSFSISCRGKGRCRVQGSGCGGWGAGGQGVAVRVQGSGCGG